MILLSCWTILSEGSRLLARRTIGHTRGNLSSLRRVKCRVVGTPKLFTGALLSSLSLLELLLNSLVILL